MQQEFCTVLALGIGGCASNGASAATETRQESQAASKEETTEADTAAESAADNVEGYERAGCTSVPPYLRAGNSRRMAGCPLTSSRI